MRLKNLLIISVLFLSIFAVDGRVKVFREKTGPLLKDLVGAIKYIFDKHYFVHDITTVFVTAVKNPDNPFLVDLKNLLMTKDKNNPHNYIFAMLNHTYIPKIRRFARNCMVVFLDTYESFNDLQKFFTPDRFSLQGFWTFVLVDGLLDDHEMSLLTEALFDKGIIHFYIMVQQDGYTHFTTTKPFHAQSCNDTKLVYRYIFKNGDFVNDTTPAQLFPKGEY